jgi:hypothetical protein
MVRLASLPSPSVTLEESVALIEGSVVGAIRQGGLAVLDAMVVSTPLISRSMLTLANGAAP